MYRPDCQFRHRESTIPGRYTLVAQKLIEHAREDPQQGRTSVAANFTTL